MTVRFPRSPRGTGWARVALLLVLWLAVSGCGGDANPPYTDRDALRTYLRQAPGVPLVLPVRLPPDHVFLGPGFEQSRDQRMFVRSMDFRVDSGDVSEVIELCVADPGTPRATCVAPDDASQRVDRRHGAYPVWVRPLGSDVLTEDERTFWTTVALSDDLDAVTWLT